MPLLLFVLAISYEYQRDLYKAYKSSSNNLILTEVIQAGNKILHLEIYKFYGTIKSLWMKLLVINMDSNIMFELLIKFLFCIS